MRQYPRLIHPVAVEIKKLDRSGTAWDNKSREPIGHVVRGTKVVLQAQVLYNRIEQPSADFEGVLRDSKGKLVFRWCDLQAAGVTISRGDKVSKIGNRTVDYFISYFEDAGHYPEFGATLLVAWFVDRTPGEG